VQCVNPFTESVKLPARSMLGRFPSVQEEDVGPLLGDTTESPQQRPLKGLGNVPHRIVKGNLLAASALLRFAL